jgi:polar amino acid transport system substrate-binding protein
MRMKSTLSLATLAAAAFAFALTTVPGTPSAQESTWDRIKKTKTLNSGCILHVPYWYKKKGSDEWVGWAIEGTKQMTKDLEPVGVKKWQCEMTTWGTAALGIQSGKVDYLFAMQATPIRATAITFAGPLYNHGFMTVNNKNFKARTWADYDKPSVKIAVIGGTSTAMVRRFVAPRATAVELPKAAEVPLSVIAGRADAMITTVINGVVAKQKNPDMGDFVIPTPLFSFPAYVGVANEPDKRFRDFVHWWAEWYRLRGQVERWVKDGLIGIGISEDSLPEKFYF